VNAEEHLRKVEVKGGELLVHDVGEPAPPGTDEDTRLRRRVAANLDVLEEKIKEASELIRQMREEEGV
jgi:hypothetical protein